MRQNTAVILPRRYIASDCGYNHGSQCPRMGWTGRALAPNSFWGASKHGEHIAMSQGTDAVVISIVGIEKVFLRSGPGAGYRTGAHVARAPRQHVHPRVCPNYRCCNRLHLGKRLQNIIDYNLSEPRSSLNDNRYSSAVPESRCARNQNRPYRKATRPRDVRIKWKSRS
jgi:hypothetical protein